MDNVEHIQADFDGIDIRAYSEIDEQRYQDEIAQDLENSLPPPQIEESIQDLEPAQPEYLDIPLSPEEIRERAKHLSFIRVAKIHFKEDWADMAVSDQMIQDSDNAQLKQIVADYKFKRDSVRSFNNIYAFVNRGLFIAEGFSSSFGFELEGLTDKLLANPEYEEALKSVLHDYQDKFHLTPMQRLGMVVAQTAIQTHMGNKAMKAINSPPESESENEGKGKKNTYEDF